MKTRVLCSSFVFILASLATSLVGQATKSGKHEDCLPDGVSLPSIYFNDTFKCCMVNYTGGKKKAVAADASGFGAAMGPLLHADQQRDLEGSINSSGQLMARGNLPGEADTPDEDNIVSRPPPPKLPKVAVTIGSMHPPLMFWKRGDEDEDP